MHKLVIIQPARIGDIIICLPIARYFAQRGKHVVWPVARSFYPMFSRAVDYVEFLSVSDNPRTWVEESLATAKAAGGDILNLAFGLIPQEPSWQCWRASGVPFDQYKYTLAGVPFDEKWNLVITRDHEREHCLFKKLNPLKPFLIYQQASSDSRADIAWKDSEKDLEKIEVSPLTDSVFDWLYTLERASKLVLVDSCMVNLVEQLHLPTKKRRLRKRGYVLEHDYPVLMEDWEEK